MAKAKTPDDRKKSEAEPPEKDDAKPESAADVPTQPISSAQIDAAKPKDLPAQDLPEIDPPAPKGEPWPDATPEPMRPVAPAGDEPPPPRPRTETVVMPTIGQFGAPPAMPRETAPPPVSFGIVEDPTHMPGPREIPGGNPEDPAPAPGHVPPGDSR